MFIPDFDREVRYRYIRKRVDFFSDMKGRLAELLLFLLLSFVSFGQRGEINLIPNSGFEEFDRAPLGWFYNGSHFSKLVKYWSSPTEASPDAYGPNIVIPRHWQDKGFGKISAFEGKAMAGITLYGCNSGKPHCREYVQVRLVEPLVRNQRYRFTIYVAALSNSYLIDRLGIAFTQQSVFTHIDTTLTIKPTMISSGIFPTKQDNWQKLMFEFIADHSYENMVVGNFFSDTETTVSSTETELNFAYYYIDGLELIKLEPILPVPVLNDDISKITFGKGDTVILKNVLFDINQSYLHPRSEKELDKLTVILLAQPKMKLKILGHTDITGKSEHNDELSYRRAAEVINYLVSKGIAANRLVGEGMGSNMPAHSNQDYLGRSLNRRVEIIVLDL